MHDPEDSRFQSSSQERGGVWSLVALSVAALCCSVLGARLLAEVVESGDLPQTAMVRSEEALRRLAGKAPRRETGASASARAIDRTPTATIPGHSSIKLDPCGDRTK